MVDTRWGGQTGEDWLAPGENWSPLSIFLTLDRVRVFEYCKIKCLYKTE